MQFYKISKPFKTHFLKVSDIHEIYVEEYGNAHGIPMLFLHGGPGAGTSPIYQKFFDPKKYHLIMFDQRGCGKSKPYGETIENTTSDLISDINHILENFSIDKINIYGGSWGSTLALLYAENSPERVATLTLRGVFLCRRDDIKWFYQHGASEIFPHYWEKYLSIVSKSKRNDILSAYYEMIHSSDEITSKRACKEWSLWEGRSSCLHPSNEVIHAFDECSISLAKIESHYFINDCFIEENQILKNINIISDIPCWIVHGQYDVVCPIRQAYDLQIVYPKSNLIIARDAGHSVLEPTISKELVKIFDEII